MNLTDEQVDTLARMYDDAMEYRLPQNQGCCPDDHPCEDHAYDRAQADAYSALVEDLQRQRSGR